MLLECGAWSAPVHAREDIALPCQRTGGPIEREQPTAAEAAVHGVVRIRRAEDHQMLVVARTRHDTIGAESLRKTTPLAGAQKSGLTRRWELPQERTRFRIECVEPAACAVDENTVVDHDGRCQKRAALAGRGRWPLPPDCQARNLRGV